MKLPRFGQVVSTIGGLWMISIGMDVVIGVVKELRK